MPELGQYDWSFLVDLLGQVTQLGVLGFFPTALPSHLEALSLDMCPRLSIQQWNMIFSQPTLQYLDITVNGEGDDDSAHRNVLTISCTTNIRTLKVDSSAVPSALPFIFPQRFLASVFENTPHLEELTVYSLSAIELQVLLGSCKNIAAIRWHGGEGIPGALGSEQLNTLLSSDTLYTLVHPSSEFGFNWWTLKILESCPKLTEWRLLRQRHELNDFMRDLMEGRCWERDLGNAEKNWYELCWEKVKKPETKQQREFVGREERKKRGFYKKC